MAIEFIKNQKDYAEKYWVHRNTAKAQMEKKLASGELKEVPEWMKYYVVDRESIIEEYLTEIRKQD